MSIHQIGLGRSYDLADAASTGRRETQPTHHANAHDDADEYEEVGVDAGGHRGDHGADDADEQPRSHHVLAAELVGEPAARNLGEDVADVEGAEDVALQHLAPHELAVLKTHEHTSLGGLQDE